jgi:hypothetical protein
MADLVPSKSIRALLCLALLITAPSCAGAGADPRPRVEFALERDLLYLGESPKLKVTVTAPPGRAVTVVKTDRVDTRRCLHANMVNPEGRIAYCLDEPHRQPVQADGDFSDLAPGQTRTMEFSVPYWYGATKPGKYRMKIEFTPTTDSEFVVRHELKVTYRAIPPEDIMCQVRMPVPPNRHHANQEDRGFVSFLNVKTDKGYELLFYRDNGHKLQFLTRVHPLDRDSTLTVVPKFFDEDSFNQEYWVVFNKGGVLYLAQLPHPVGGILRKTVIEVQRWTPPK